MIKQLTYLFLAWLILATLTGCATLRGMGEDFQNLGRGIKKTVSGSPEK